MAFVTAAAPLQSEAEVAESGLKKPLTASQGPSTKKKSRGAPGVKKPVQKKKKSGASKKKVPAGSRIKRANRAKLPWL
jgi:hypothetical protein